MRPPLSAHAALLFHKMCERFVRYLLHSIELNGLSRLSLTRLWSKLITVSNVFVYYNKLNWSQIMIVLIVACLKEGSVPKYPINFLDFCWGLSNCCVSSPTKFQFVKATCN
jgi:hypothetical protein